MRVLVLADTHVRDGGGTRLPDQAWEEVRRADVILHAGDIVGPEFLAALRKEASEANSATVHAVLGNNDGDLVRTLPETTQLNLAGVEIAMIHDSGPAAGREGRLHRRFPTAQVVVFGHSHIPWNRRGLDGQLLFNPGSPTQRRSQPHRTVGVLQLRAGEVQSAEHVVVD